MGGRKKISIVDVEIDFICTLDVLFQSYEICKISGSAKHDVDDDIFKACYAFVAEFLIKWQNTYS